MTPEPEKISLAQWVKLILVYLMIPGTLFICAWDIAWWQGWVYGLLIFTVGVGGRAWAEKRHPGLMAERVKFEKNADVKPWDKILAPLMALSVGFPLVIALLRTALEDKTLQAELPGYREYAQRVRYRLFPGIY